jgi:hypothetical protein
MGRARKRIKNVCTGCGKVFYTKLDDCMEQTPGEKVYTTCGACLKMEGL